MNLHAIFKSVSAACTLLKQTILCAVYLVLEVKATHTHPAVHHQHIDETSFRTTKTQPVPKRLCLAWLQVASLINQSNRAIEATMLAQAGCLQYRLPRVKTWMKRSSATGRLSSSWTIRSTEEEKLLQVGVRCKFSYHDHVG